MARLEPLPIGAAPELKEMFEKQLKTNHYVANSQLIMQRKPKLVLAMRGLSAAVFDPDGEVSLGLKRLLAYSTVENIGGPRPAATRTRRGRPDRRNRRRSLRALAR